jgi:methylthioribose-1-phosphate isomerase
VPTATPQPLASVRWDDDAVVIIDQRRLPLELVESRLASVADVVEAIRTLAVRGAPAIGIAAAYGLVVGLDEARPASGSAALAALARLEDEIGAARPTAVNLAAALARVRSTATRSGAGTAGEIRAAALAEARALHEADRIACSRIGEHGRALLAGRTRLLTHCNTGRLATAGDGTALAIVYALQAAGEQPQVLATESRPLLQGSRLTAWELGASGVDVRLIVDSAAAAAMAAGLVEAVLVGCDRVAANGDTANKIGTYSLAVLARHHDIPFYVAGPLSTFDLDTADGSGIVIEERSADEVRRFAGQPSAPVDVAVWNPAFDVTPAELITAFVTEVGVLEPPYADSIARAAREGSWQADPAVVDGSEAWTTELPGDTQAVVAGTRADR